MKTRVFALSLAALLCSGQYCLAQQLSAVDTESVNSSPSDRTDYVRALDEDDLNPLGSDRGAIGAGIFLRNLVVSNTDPDLTNTDTAGDGEPSIAINPLDPDEIVILAFSGGWGANAPLWHSTNGGNTWSKLFTIPDPATAGSGGCPCDQAPDYGRDGRLAITFLTSGPTDIITGTTTDPTDAGAWSWSNDGVNPAENVNESGSSQGNSDQPWLLVNVDPGNPSQDLIHNAYDDFGQAPDMRVSSTPNDGPADFTGDDELVGFSTGFVNPGHRQAKDPVTGFVYSAWQRELNQDGADPKNIDFMLTRSTDGGQTWGLNGNPNGIIVGNGDSSQPRPKFGTVNALLGGVLHVTVDPTLGHVYCVHGDRDPVTGNDRLSIVRLEDDGTGNLFVAHSGFVTGQVEAAIPSVAVASDGTVGVFYYTFDGFSSGSFPIFTAWLALSRDGGVTFDHRSMLTFLSAAQDNGNNRQRVLGDYVQMKTLGRTFYGTFTANGASFGRPFANHDPYFFKETVGPIIAIDAPTDFGVVCLDETDTNTVDISNVGGDPLVIADISKVSGDADIDLGSVPQTPLTLAPGSHIGFGVDCAPTGYGVKTATIRIESDDPDQPIVDLDFVCDSAPPDLTTVIADSGNFGDVCAGDFHDLDLTLNNGGECELEVNDILSTSPEFHTAGVVNYPLAVAAGGSIAVPIRFEPTSVGAKAAMLSVLSDDPDTPSADVLVSGNAPAGDIDVSGATELGPVCAGTGVTTEISVCNTGDCDITVSSVFISQVGNPGGVCNDFTIVSTPLPGPVGPDTCLPISVQFTPTSAGPKSCQLNVLSDDPDEGTVELILSAETPLGAIAVSGDMAFLPEVVQTAGACSSSLPLSVVNAGICPVEIASAVMSTNPAEFGFSGLPPTPVMLLPGEQLGDGQLEVVFEPDALDRDVLGAWTVDYVADPIAGTTLSESGATCGEGVLTGARVLVRASGVPLAAVKKIQLKRRTTAGWVDVAHNAALETVSPDAPCGGFQYHREYGTVDNPIQLLPGHYEVNVQAKIDGRMRKKKVTFDVSTCDFNPQVIVDF